MYRANVLTGMPAWIVRSANFIFEREPRRQLISMFTDSARSGNLYRLENVVDILCLLPILWETDSNENNIRQGYIFLNPFISKTV